MRPVADEGEEEAESGAGEGEDVGQPEVLEVKNGEGGGEPAEDGQAEGWDEVCCAAGGCRGECPPAGGPEDANCELNGRVAEADGGVALAAAAKKNKPAQEGDIFPPGEGVIAMAAVGARGGEAFFFREADEQNVEKTAEGESEQKCEEGGDDLDCVGAGDG